MRPRAPFPASLSLVVAALLACSGAAVAPPSEGPTVTSAADLPPARPPRREGRDGQRASTGTPSALVRAGRRAQVVELYSEYIRAVYEQSLDVLRPLLAERLVGVAQGQAGAPLSREDVLALHDRLFHVIDPGGAPLSEVLDVPQVRSYAEHRRAISNAYLALRPGDWLVEGAPRFTRNALPTDPHRGLARLLLVRWEGDRPVIAGMSEELLRHARR